VESSEHRQGGSRGGAAGPDDAGGSVPADGRLRVIGAGLGRTGTFSLKHALEHLGYGPCYHMFELMQRPEHLPEWRAALAGDAVHWERVLGAYGSAVDYPAAFFWRELRALSPDAYVVLTVRDPDSWYESAYETIYRPEPGLLGKLGLLLRIPFSKRLRAVIETGFFARELVWSTHFDGRFSDRAFAIETYLAHNEAVRQEVPAAQLLEYRVGEGWAPLCHFLGEPVPEAPFPCRNDRREFTQLQRRFLSGRAPA
jgi:hypothetical protein